MARPPGKATTADEKAGMARPKPAIDHDLIRDLAKLLDETGLTEIEFERDGQRVRVVRRGKAVKATSRGAAPVEAPANPKSQVAPSEPAKHPGLVTSPMVGTAYRSPEPGAPPFVEVGGKVRAGETLLIIEAMKTMNHIPAPRAGTIVQILFEDRQPVEFGEALLIIE